MSIAHWATHPLSNTLLDGPWQNLSWQHPKLNALIQRCKNAKGRSNHAVTWQCQTEEFVSLYLSSTTVSIIDRGERIVFSGPNTNIIRVHKFDRIRIRILFVFCIMTEYEYEYYSGSEIWPNTNTNIIRAQKFDRIRIRILRLCE